jgi:hydroxymethylglutaryl-CoA lyase
MPNFPRAIHIKEYGPREGFQIESADIPTARKIELIDALSATGLEAIEVCSFVDPRRVPQMAHAEEIVAGITLQPGVAYHALWLNERGLERAIAIGRLTLAGSVGVTASDAFLRRNQNRTFEQQVAATHSIVEMYKRHNIPVPAGSLSAAFGCNFEGEISDQRMMELARLIFDIAEEHGITLERFNLFDTMAWATPNRIRSVVGALQDSWPDVEIMLHLHDTRGMGIANAYAGLEMGVTRIDASVAGLGGCPFAGHRGAAGNVCTEDLVFLCEEIGIETGVDLEALIECARLAEDIVGHPLPGSVMRGGSLSGLRRRLRNAA